MVPLLWMEPRDYYQQMLILGPKFTPDALPRIHSGKLYAVEVNTIQDQVDFSSRRLFNLDQMIGSVMRHGYYCLTQPGGEAVKPYVPLLVDPGVIIGIVPGDHPRVSASKRPGHQPDDGRLEQMSVQNIDSLAAQVSRQTNHVYRIVDPGPAVAAKPFAPFRWHR